jgi:2-dehydro-3-deoxygalactonokinase
VAGEPVILGDWGGTKLRVWLRRGGATLASGEAPGLLLAGNEPAQVLRAAIAALGAEARSCRIVLCGMAGARGGLGEAGYVPCPGGVDEWVGAAVRTSLGEHPVTILPGFAGRDGEGRPDVMRGEEAQVFGVLAAHEAAGDGPRAIVLPGTHSKWVGVQGPRIARFATCPTGELHARLMGSSLVPEADGANAGWDAEGFDAGLDRARGGGAPMASLFEARAAQMLDGRTGAWARSFLSGLLIGSEIAALARWLEPGASPWLIGSAELVGLYHRAFGQFGLACRTADGDICALRGLEIADARLG